MILPESSESERLTKLTLSVLPVFAERFRRSFVSPVGIPCTSFSSQVIYFPFAPSTDSAVIVDFLFPSV